MHNVVARGCYGSVTPLWALLQEETWRHPQNRKYITYCNCNSARATGICAAQKLLKFEHVVSEICVWTETEELITTPTISLPGTKYYESQSRCLKLPCAYTDKTWTLLITVHRLGSHAMVLKGTGIANRHELERTKFYTACI